MNNKNIYDTGLYLRLSRDDADVDGSKKTESNSISSQRDILRAYVQSHEDLQIYDIYIDATCIIGTNQSPREWAAICPYFSFCQNFWGRQHSG